MRIELHAHTAEHSSCSRLPALELVRYVSRQEINGVVITDHHYLWSDEALTALKDKAGVPDDFIILSGQEVSTADFGDVLVYGASYCYPMGTYLTEIQAGDPEAAIVWAHPYRGGRLPSEKELYHPFFDAIEIINTHHQRNENSRAVLEWRRCGFNAVSGTDIHRDDLMEFFPTEFKNPITTLSDLLTELKEGRGNPTIPKALIP